MIGMVEGAKRRKTPNEVALTILLTAHTDFLIGMYHSLPFQCFCCRISRAWRCYFSSNLDCFISVLFLPRSAAYFHQLVAGMSRMLDANVIATSGRAVEAAGDVDILLLDKTGTITLGNRQASRFIPLSGISENSLRMQRS